MSQPKPDAYDEELEKWFAQKAHIISRNPFCWNCKKEYISEPFYRHATAHIIAKSIAPSVATHPDNFLILAATCGCHSKFDSSVETASKMPIFKLAVSRFRKFEHLITERHKIVDLFRQYADKIQPL